MYTLYMLYYIFYYSYIFYCYFSFDVDKTKPKGGGKKTIPKFQLKIKEDIKRLSFYIFYRVWNHRHKKESVQEIEKGNVI